MGVRRWLSGLYDATFRPSGPAVPYHVPRPPPAAEMDYAAAAALLTNGAVTLPSLVPSERVRAAREAIERALGQGATAEDLGRMPEILALYHQTPLRAFVEALLDAGVDPDTVGRELMRDYYSSTHRVTGAQVAIREPSEGCGTSGGVPPSWDSHWHVDGLWHDGPDGIKHTKKGEVGQFDALVGVCLTDGHDAPFRGNLTVWPGGHELMAAQFASTNLLQRLKDAGLSALPRPQDLRPCPARQLMLRAGDVCVVNYLMPHTVAPNVGSRRIMVYFRVSSRWWAGHGELPQPALASPWHHWPGLRRRIAQSQNCV